MPHLLHSLLVPVLLLANVALLASLVALLAGVAASPAGLSQVTPGLVLDWYWLTFAIALFLTVSVYAQQGGHLSSEVLPKIRTGP